MNRHCKHIESVAMPSTRIDALAVSIVVCARNAANHLPHLLVALDAQTLAPERFELIYVDDASTDGSLGIVYRHGKARVVQASSHVGLPRARNLGIGSARGPIIAFTDADTRPDPQWLERGLCRFATSGADLLGGGISISIGNSPSIGTLTDASTYLAQEEYIGRLGFVAGAN